jgi:flavocytochrome c
MSLSHQSLCSCKIRFGRRRQNRRRGQVDLAIIFLFCMSGIVAVGAENNSSKQTSAKEKDLVVESSFFEQTPITDAIVIGSGLAGLTAALSILDRWGTVWLVEKEPYLGGNSNKASSGISGCCFEGGNSSTIALSSEPTNDTLDLFLEDTLLSAGDIVDRQLLTTLVRKSAMTIKWLRQRVGVDLSAPQVQLGGHSRKRTHRPTAGFVGAEVMAAMENAIHAFETRGKAHVLVEHTVTRIIKDSAGRVRGVEVQGSADEPVLLRSDNVILATGGFASDRSEGSLLRQYRPELQNMAATQGLFSTGDGIHLAQNIGATTRDMEKIQIHPTGFVDPADPTSTHKVLAAELLRGVGGILLNKRGQRFCNELGTRDYVTDKMLEHDDAYRESRTWNPDTAIPTFYLLLSAEAAQKAARHVGTYTRKGLITRLHGLKNLASYLEIPHDTLASTIREYQSFARREGGDVFGKKDFEGLPGEDLEAEAFYVGEVTPVLHYCMGGVKITASGEVLSSDGSSTIPGLYAVGELTGGVHGNNQLGGNSLLECAVFGTIVGKKIPLNGYESAEAKSLCPNRLPPPTLLKPQTNLTLAELSHHNEPTDCYVGLHGKLYDLSTFIHYHVGGMSAISSLCGREASGIFSSVHTRITLTRVERHLIGYLGDADAGAETCKNDRQVLSEQDIAHHNSPDNCWLLIDGTVYNLTQFSEEHPGGAEMIQKMAGQDATSLFERFHHKDQLRMAIPYVVGKFSDESK